MRKMKGPWISAALLLCLAAAATAEGPLDPGKAALLAAGTSGDGEPARDAAASRAFVDAAAAAAVRAFSAYGVAVETAEAVGGSESADPWSASEAARAAGARWAVTARIDLAGRLLSWRFDVYDASAAALLASDAFSGFAGLSSLPGIDESARRAAAAWSLAKDEGAPELPVQFRLSFVGGTAGTAVSVSQPDLPARTVGELGPKGLLASYVPLAPDAPVTVEYSRDGYWPRSAVLKKGPTEKPIRAPRLSVRARNGVALGAGLGQLPGFSVGYRRYLSPDASFIRIDNVAWTMPSRGPGSSAVYHDEVRLGFGAFLTTDRDGGLRFGVGTGLSGIFTYSAGFTGYDSPWGFDAVLNVLSVNLEFHRPRWAFVLEQRLPFSLGSGTGFLPAGWVELGDGGPPFVSAGVLIKW